MFCVCVVTSALCFESSVLRYCFFFFFFFQAEDGIRDLIVTGVQTCALPIWFKTIFPAAYSGRWPHIHFELYSSVATAVASGPIVKTSQIALPQAACRKVYATSGYPGSLGNLARTSLSTDMVFSDDRAIHQLATVT